MTIFKTSDCTCGVWHSITPPPPCRIHQPQAWFQQQPFVTTTSATLTFVFDDVSPVKRPPRKSR